MSLTEYIKVDVTQEDIDRGSPHCDWACPIAISLRRLAEQPVSISVGSERVSVGDELYAHSRTSMRFVCAFDSGRPVRPARFVLRKIGTLKRIGVKP